MPQRRRALARREQQIMDILYEKGRATAMQVMESMTDPPGYSAVRTLLATLERKGYIRHDNDGVKYVYVPVAPRAKAQRAAISQLIDTFYHGSRGRAAAALLDVAPGQLSDEELDEIEGLIQKARKGARR